MEGAEEVRGMVDERERSSVVEGDEVVEEREIEEESSRVVVPVTEMLEVVERISMIAVK